MFNTSGKDKIAAAIGSFTKVVVDLKAGVTMVEKENTQLERGLDIKRTAFAKAEAEVGERVSGNNESITQAIGVIGNIEKLLIVEDT